MEIEMDSSLFIFIWNTEIDWSVWRKKTFNQIVKSNCIANESLKANVIAQAEFRLFLEITMPIKIDSPINCDDVSN